MDQERFDKLTRTLASGSSRRKVLGGVLAGLGAGLASVSGLPAQGKKNRKRKGRAGAEFTCSAANANNPFLGGCSDPDSCCASTAGGLGPICVTVGTQLSGTQQFCGKLNDAGPGNRGSGVCRTCPAGTVCSRDADNEVRCICTPGTCPNGCCINNDLTDQDDTCVQNGSGVPVNSVNPRFDGNSVCGFGGSECRVCSLGTIFAGCCTATGACNAGTTGISCGSGGGICGQCEPGKNCINQTCETDPVCNSASCGNGCCDTNGACRNGNTNAACGEGGGPCVECSATQVCQGQTCVADTPVGTCGPGTANPCTEGCCFESSPGVFRCESGGAKNACGTGGQTCLQCGGARKCTGKGTCKRRMM